MKTKPKYIVIEDLNVIGMLKNKKLSKVIQEQSLREFRRQLDDASLNLRDYPIK
ncbi:hypothetical protein [Crassaminicella thermophila]|uniref:hypothetical protein n=1 Tax=Crassaminicella thermophila TaxID=2599308 RepID=UPI00143DFFDE|nr:hypothetical protein [Crassaminicella thermophila]